MSKASRRPRTDLPAREPERKVWIKTEPTVDGATFVVTLEATEDVSHAFDRDSAMRYASYVHEAAALAEYDAAVIAQLVETGIKDFDAMQMVADLRKDRPEREHPWPLVLTPGVSARTRRGFLTISLQSGEPLGQWDAEDARGHAAHVIEAVAVADLDAGYLRLLRGVVGVPEATARAMIEDLGSHR